MRRALALLAIAALLLAGAAGLGFWLATGFAPEQLRAGLEARLAERLAMPVRVAEVRTALRYGAVLEARGVRAGPDAEAPALEVESLLARLDAPELVAGRLRLDWVVLDGAVLRLERDGRGLRLAGSTAPPETPAVPEAEPPPAPGPLERARDALAALGRSLDTGPLAAERVEVRGGRLEILDATLAEAGAEPVAWGIDELDLRLGERWMPVGWRLGADGLLRIRGEERGRVALRADADPHPRAELELRDLDLEALAGVLAPERGLRGTLRGQLGWSAPDAAPAELRVELAAPELRVGRGRDGSRWRDARLEAELEVDEDRLRLRSARVASAVARLEASGSLALPATRDAVLDLQARLRPLALHDLGEVAGRVSAAARPLLGEGLDAVEAGRVHETRVALRTRLHRLPALLDSPLEARPGELRVRSRVSGVALRLDDGQRIDELGGELDFRGDGLELRQVTGRLDAQPLPRFDARLGGLAHLAGHDAAVHCVAPRSVPPLPGRAVLNQALAGSDPEQPRRWERIVVEAEHVLHPALLCSLERVRATLEPAEDGVALQIEEGVWAGIALRAEGRFRAGDADAFDLAIEIEQLAAPIEPPADETVWARGLYRAELTRFGPWRSRRAEGAFRAEGARLTLDETRLDLDPGGELAGSFALDFDRPDALPWRLRLQVPPIDLGDLSRSMGRDDPQIAGTMVGGADLRGSLRPGRPALAEAEGLFSLHGRSGYLRRRLPALLAMTVAGDRLSPFPARETIPFSAFDLVLDVEDGRAHSRLVSLDGPSLRLVAEGEVGLVTPYPLEAVVGMLFFRRLDSVIQRLPVLNRVLLGTDENLVNAYFALEGPWSEPEARLVPIKSLASGPASFVLEGLPAFVRGGLERLLSLLPDGGGDEAAESVPRADS